DLRRPEVSPIRAKQKLSEALETGNYGLALEWCETVLARYPSHPEFLRAKASVLLLMGEREKAIEFYERAEEVESSPAVRQKLEELRNSE
ncbi:MAG: tetratricopeptide repeat protein, partial [Myxococcota bacterium]